MNLPARYSYSCKLQTELHLLGVLHNVTPQKLNKLLTFRINWNKMCVNVVSKPDVTKLHHCKMKVKSPRMLRYLDNVEYLIADQKALFLYVAFLLSEQPSILRASQSLCKYIELYIIMPCFWRAQNILVTSTDYHDPIQTRDLKVHLIEV